MTTNEFDVVVIGGGPAGSATAMLLAQAGLSVLLLEISDYSGPRTGETLSPHVSRQLIRLGVFEHFKRQGHIRIPGIVSVWGTQEPHVNDFFCGEEGLGWHVDRSTFDRMMAECAERAGVTLRSSARIVSPPKASSKGWRLEIDLEGRRSFCTFRFLIDATGRSGSSWLSCLSPRILIDRLIGVIWTGDCQTEFPYMAVESVDGGWFYSADLPGGRATVAYITDSDLYRQERKNIPNPWSQRLSQTTYARRRLSCGTDLSALRTVSAASMIRASAVGENWCAVGDAAFSIDPLSGLGVQNALESAERAASAIQQHLANGKSLASYLAWITEMIDAYLVARQHYYARERRWPDSVFWQRRARQ